MINDENVDFYIKYWKNNILATYLPEKVDFDTHSGYQNSKNQLKFAFFTKYQQCLKSILEVVETF